MESWFADATRVSSIEAEVCFLLQEDFYYGPDTFPEVAEQKFVEPLPVPNIPREVPSMVRTSEAIGNETELVRYYSEVIRLGRKHRKQFHHISHYFWIRFWLWNTAEDVHIGFPWYDSYSEIQDFLNGVSAKEEGRIFWDMDQGWELEVHAAKNDFFARVRDPDSDEIHAVVCCPRDVLLYQLAELEGRTEALIAALSTSIRRDLWTSRVDWPTFLTDVNSV